jgi:hypothetical protein
MGLRPGIDNRLSHSQLKSPRSNFNEQIESTHLFSKKSLQIFESTSFICRALCTNFRTISRMVQGTRALCYLIDLLTIAHFADYCFNEIFCISVL